MNPGKRIHPKKEKTNVANNISIVNGLTLPKSLVKRLQNDCWKVPVDKTALKKLVVMHYPFEQGDEDLAEDIEDFTLYDVELMIRESEGLQKWEKPAWKAVKSMIMGDIDARISPGNIMHHRTVLFADFGIGSDTPFGLDYRENITEPSVVLLYWGEEPSDNRWKKIANSFEEFERLIWAAEEY